MVVSLFPQDTIPSVRQGAAVAISNVVKAYGRDALPLIVEKMKEGLKGEEATCDLICLVLSKVV